MTSSSSNGQTCISKIAAKSIAASKSFILPTTRNTCANSCRTSADVNRGVRFWLASTKNWRAGSLRGCGRPTAYTKTLVSMKITGRKFPTRGTSPSPPDVPPSLVPARYQSRAGDHICGRTSQVRRVADMGAAKIRTCRVTRLHANSDPNFEPFFAPIISPTLHRAAR